MHPRKGITPIIATILLLLITIALASMAYSFLNGYFTGTTNKLIQIMGQTCIGSAPPYTAVFYFKNVGTATLNVNCPTATASGNSYTCGDFQVQKLNGPGAFTPASPAIDVTSLPPESFTSFSETGCTGTCRYHTVVGGRSLETEIRCG